MNILIDALNYIDPSTCDYEQWMKYGMALNYEASRGQPVSVLDWDTWSSRDSRPGQYQPGLCEEKWNSFNRFNGDIVTGGTIINDALRLGFSPIKNKTYDFDNFYLEEDYDDFIESRGKEIVRFLKNLYEPDEHINYVFDVKYNKEKDKYYPAKNGQSSFTRDQIIAQLEKFDYDIEEALGAYNTDAGGWIRINPVDGKGVGNSNITAFRYTLIECDEIDINSQYRKILELKLPCAAIINSGKRSIHAIVHIDAKDESEYKKRVEWMYKTLMDLGLPLDKNNKNASRLTRFPTLQRGDQLQELIQLNVGLKDFNEWQEYVENGLEELSLPEIVSFSEVCDNLPELKPELIEGVLRQGHKMILAATSKAGKSYSLIDLAISVAEGKKWIDFNCAQGKVLYINLEIDSASFLNRIENVYQAHKWEKTNAQNLDILNMRGMAMSSSKLIPKLIRRIKDKDYRLIILDPIYKIQSGDENAAGDIAKFTNELDKLASETGASIVYCHHHSKGSQVFKKSIDRASGSGVFARDADTIIDIIELSNETFKDLEEYQDMRAFRIEGTLREFEEFSPVNVFYDFPIYKIDTLGVLDEAIPLDEFLLNNSKAKGKTKDKDRDVPGYVKLKNAYDLLNIDGSGVLFEDICEALHLKERQVRQYMTDYNIKSKKEKFYTRNRMLILN